MPFSFYCLSPSQENYLLDVKETQSGGATNTYSITIPSGNYSITELLDVIKDLMEAASTYSFIYNFTYINYTNKVDLLISSGTDVSKTRVFISKWY